MNSEHEAVSTSSRAHSGQALANAPLAEGSGLARWYDENPAPSMSVCATREDYWRAMYEHREKEAHALSEELVRQHALKAQLREALQTIANMPTESDEWDGAEKYIDCREMARAAISKAIRAERSASGADTPEQPL